jgi:hypothetical protein
VVKENFRFNGEKMGLIIAIGIIVGIIWSNVGLYTVTRYYHWHNGWIKWKDRDDWFATQNLSFWRITLLSPVVIVFTLLSYYGERKIRTQEYIKKTVERMTKD